MPDILRKRNIGYFLFSLFFRNKDVDRTDKPNYSEMDGLHICGRVTAGSGTGSL